MIISFEGIDGSGKTTQAYQLKRYLNRKGYNSELVREPGGVPFAEKLREILLDKSFSPSILAESFTFLASRAETIEKKIKPLVKKGKIIIMDRFVDSTLAYQAFGGGASLDILKQLNTFVTDGLLPKITFYIDVDVDTAISRQKNFTDRMEKLGPLFFEKVREGYLHIAQSEPKRVKVIDGIKTAKAIHEEIIGICNEILFN